MAKEKTKGTGQHIGGKTTDANPIAVKAKESTQPKTLVEKFHSASSGPKTMVEFIESPCGVLHLGYHVGESATFTKNQADLLFDLGLAKPVK